MSIKKYDFDTDGSVAIVRMRSGSMRSGGYVVKGGKITHRLWDTTLAQLGALDFAVAAQGGEPCGVATLAGRVQEITWLDKSWCMIALPEGTTVESIRQTPSAVMEADTLKAVEEHLIRPTHPTSWKTMLHRARPSPPQRSTGLKL